MKVTLRLQQGTFVPEESPDWDSCPIYIRQVLGNLQAQDHPLYSLMNSCPEEREFWIGAAQAAVRFVLSDDGQSGIAYIGE